MTVADDLLQRARTMGETAGRTFVETGVPFRCPFGGVDKLRDPGVAGQLARAWTAGYVQAETEALKG